MKQGIRLQWIAVVLVMSLNSALGYSQSLSHDISEFELNRLITNLSDEVSKLDTQDSVAKIDQYLNSFQPVEQIIVMHLWLKQLSYQHDISEPHFLWVRSLMSSNAVLLSRLSDHPQKQIAVINIAEQARSVVKINQIKNLVTKIDQQWLAGEFTWVDWLADNPNNYAALVDWLTVQDQDIDIIKQSFVANSISVKWPNNQILTILIEKAPSTDLFSLLWQRSVDEYTYQAIHRLPEVNDSVLVVEQLVEAMKIKQLTSQALLSLATHYPLDETAQMAIETSLDKPDQQWYALMALDKMNAPDFKKTLLLKFKQHNSRFAESAIKMIEDQMLKSESRDQR